MGWWITLGVLLLLAVLPLGVSVRYNADGLAAKVIAGPIKITLFPRPKKEKKKNKPEKEKPEQKSEEENLPKPPQPPAPSKEKKSREEKKEKGGSLTDFIPFVRLALNFLGDFRRKLRLNLLEVKLILGGGDPCDLAVNYGKTWAAVGNLMPQLERLFVIKKKDVEVECDFTASETKVIAHVDVTITLGRLIALAVNYGIRGIREFLNFQKKRKGGAVK